LLLTKTKDGLTQHFSEFYIGTLSSQPSRVNFEVEVSYRGAELFRFEELHRHFLLSPPGYQKHDLREVMDRSGMYDLEVEFNPASEAQIEINNRWIELYGQGKTKMPSKIRSSDPNFKNWFQNVCSLLGTKVHLIPDTNIIRRLYYTNYLKRMVIEDQSHMTIALPRLGILEVENKYNSNKRSEKKSPTDQKEKTSYLEREKKKARERIISYQSMGEILSMKNDGAKVLPAYDMDLIRAFPSEAGRGNADALIRREVSSSRPYLIKTQLRSGKIETSSNILFLTCDLMNSLAAIAEDLNTIYFYRPENSIPASRRISHDKLSGIVFNTAIHFGECDVMIRWKEKERRLKIKGTWPGKSAYEWQYDFIEVEGAT
jgi:hypothetical protein